jgi:hypothetical protein
MSSQLARFQKAMALRTALLQQGGLKLGAGVTGGRKRKMKRGASVIGIRSGLPVRHRRATSMGMSYGGARRKMKRGGTAKQKAVAARNPWLLHVRKFRMAHPNLSYKQVLTQAAKTYRRGAGITGGRKRKMRR